MFLSPHFPFLVALDNPGEIGADDEEVDPLKVLAESIGGSNPWVRPQQGDLWFAAGLAFDCFETFRGHAMALVQTGSDLSISLLGVGGTQLPTKSDKKIARVEIGIEATLRPMAGELSIGAAFTEKTFLIDPNCKLRGGVGMKFWFGNHPHAGDFALMLGAIPPGRELPVRYPRQQPAGLTWGLGSTDGSVSFQDPDSEQPAATRRTPRRSCPPCRRTSRRWSATCWTSPFAPRGAGRSGTPTTPRARTCAPPRSVRAPSCTGSTGRASGFTSSPVVWLG